MDFQRDYILRMIEMMGDFMRRIKELLQDLDRMSMLGDLCHRHCGMKLETARSLTVESLTELLPMPSRLWLAEIWYTQAMYTDQASDERQELLLRSFKLLLLIGEGTGGDVQPVYAMRKDRVQELLKELNPVLTSAEVMAGAAFLFQGDAYAWGEDAAFDAIITAPKAQQGELIQAAQGLLASLLHTPEKKLIGGGLPKVEVEEGLAQLEAMEENLIGDHP